MKIFVIVMCVLLAGVDLCVAEVIIDATKHGVKLNSPDDQTKAVLAVIAVAKEARVRQPKEPIKVFFPKSTYYLGKEDATRLSFYISNHDQSGEHPIGVPITEMENVTFEWSGSMLICRDAMLAVLLRDTKNVTVRNLFIEFEPHIYPEAKIVGFDGDKVHFEINPQRYPFEVRDGGLCFVGKHGGKGFNSAIVFKKDTLHIAEYTSDVCGQGRVEDLGNGRVSIEWNLRSRGLGEGDILILRTWDRPHPAMCLYRAENTILENVVFHNSYGMALLAQRSKNVWIKGGGCIRRKGSPDVCTAGADATHFSNCAGKVRVESALYENMMDDAINVHSTCLRIDEVQAPNVIKCRYMHFQAVGFEVFQAGERIKFFKGKTLDSVAVGKVMEVKVLNPHEVVITLESNLPEGVGEGDAVENADFYPAVEFVNNVVRNNRARCALFTTPKRVLVEGNLFDHCSGSAILLAGDAKGWYESGACSEVIIRKNKFINNLTSRYQFTEAVLSFFPEVKQLGEQKQFYHSNILIADNDFVTHRVPLLFAVSTDGIKFINNSITYNDTFRPWPGKPFSFRRCDNIVIKGNKVKNAEPFTTGSVSTQLMPTDAVQVK